MSTTPKPSLAARKRGGVHARNYVLHVPVKWPERWSPEARALCGRTGGNFFGSHREAVRADEQSDSDKGCRQCMKRMRKPFKPEGET
jgi:hypothetical protein